MNPDTLHDNQPVSAAGATRFAGVIETARLLTPTIKHVRIALQSPTTIAFHPGQTIRLRIPTAAAKIETWRMYSISNPPEDPCAVELCVRRVPGGVSTSWIFDRLNPNDEVTFTGPYGRFALSASTMPMVWIAGGSGIAPFWSMLRHMANRGLTRPCRLFLGAASKAEVPLLEEIRRLERQLDWLTFLPVIEACTDESWTGQVGLVTQALDRALGMNEPVEAYLCGPPALVESSLEVLSHKRISPDRIFIDKFVPAPPARHPANA
jgi:Na+-transporting NADH:ubiquinone oxidoreductase subunit F